MPPKKEKPADDLTTYRVDVLEKRQDSHEAEDKKKHAEIDEKIVGMRLELMKVVVKVGVGGYVLGAVGSYILQKFGNGLVQ